jgi:hypothetical protein
MVGFLEAICFCADSYYFQKKGAREGCGGFDRGIKIIDAHS